MLEYEMLAAILSGDLNLIPQYKNQFDRFDTECVLAFTPLHVKTMLENYLYKRITAEDLECWAEFTCYCDAYVAGTVAGNEDFYENMYTVLQWTSSPYLDGEITPERITEYLSFLNISYFNEIIDV